MNDNKTPQTQRLFKIKVFDSKELETKLSVIASKLLQFDKLSNKEYSHLLQEYLSCIATRYGMDNVKYSYDKKIGNIFSSYTLAQKNIIWFHPEFFNNKGKDLRGFLKAVNVMEHEMMHNYEIKLSPYKYKKITKEDGLYKERNLRDSYFLLKWLATGTGLEEEIVNLSKFNYTFKIPEIVARQTANTSCSLFCDKLCKAHTYAVFNGNLDRKTILKQRANIIKALNFVQENIEEETDIIESKQEFLNEIKTSEIKDFCDEMFKKYVNDNLKYNNKTNIKVDTTIKHYKDCFLRILILPEIYSQKRTDAVINRELEKIDIKTINHDMKNIMEIIDSPLNSKSIEMLNKSIDAINKICPENLDSFYNEYCVKNLHNFDERILQDILDNKKIEFKKNLIENKNKKDEKQTLNR